MSNITFNSGDYDKLQSIGVQNGLIYFNTDNRNISVSGASAITDFNSIIVNDNRQCDALSAFTCSAKYLVDNKIFIENNSENYYNVTDATNKIGTTTSSMTDGYIYNLISQLIDGITYPSLFDVSVIQSEDTHSRYTIKTYTIYKPNFIPNHEFNNIIVFAYDTSENKVRLIPFVYNVGAQENAIIQYKAQNSKSDSDSYPATPTIEYYKAFWV